MESKGRTKSSALRWISLNLDWDVLLGLSEKPLDWRKESMNLKELWIESISLLLNTWPFQIWFNSYILERIQTTRNVWTKCYPFPESVQPVVVVDSGMRPCVPTVQHYQMQSLRRGKRSLNDLISNRCYLALHKSLLHKNASQTKNAHQKHLTRRSLPNK